MNKIMPFSSETLFGLVQQIEVFAKDTGHNPIHFQYSLDGRFYYAVVLFEKITNDNF